MVVVSHGSMARLYAAAPKARQVISPVLPSVPRLQASQASGTACRWQHPGAFWLVICFMIG